MACRESLGGPNDRTARGWYQGLQPRRRRDHGPIEGAVATAAIKRGVHMLDLLARGGDAVVATLAGGADLEMTKGGRSPSNRAVTRAAILRRLNVPYRLARSGNSVVAGGAGGRYTAMIKSCG